MSAHIVILLILAVCAGEAVIYKLNLLGYRDAADRRHHF